jgi:hypothetical protein
VLSKQSEYACACGALETVNQRVKERMLLGSNGGRLHSPVS